MPVNVATACCDNSLVKLDEYYIRALVHHFDHGPSAKREQAYTKCDYRRDLTLTNMVIARDTHGQCIIQRALPGTPLGFSRLPTGFR